MEYLENYRDSSGRININLAEDDGVLDIERNPQQSIAGARTKYWCSSDNGDVLYKKTLTNNYEDYGEILGYELAKLVELPCAQYDFATFDDLNGVITQDIAKDNEELVGGDEILKIVSAYHIIPIQKICLEYNRIKQSKKSDSNDYTLQKEYINELINLYNCSLIRNISIDSIITDTPLNVNTIDIFEKTLEDYFEELSLLYEYGFLGYNSTSMTDEEKEEKQKFDDYFKERGYELSGWNKQKKVVVSNNLVDIWSLIDNYCSIKGYHSDTHEIMYNLIKMFIYDSILNQGDRHISNWSLIVNNDNNTIRFAPIYDNSKICGLDESKEIIMQKAKSILSFFKNQDGMSEEKRKRTILNIERNLSSGSDSKLMVDYNDNYYKNNKYLMIEKLLNISDDEVREIILYFIDKFRSENILEVFKKIEISKNIIIPEEVKVVTLKTIELNIKKLNSIVLKYDERRSL